MVTKRRSQVDGFFTDINELVNYSGIWNSGAIVTLNDGSEWKLTGNTGTARQTPGQRVNATLTDANGNEFKLVINKDNNVKQLGATGSAQSTTATLVATTSVTLANEVDFKNGDVISIEHGGLATTLTSPTGLTVSASGLNRQGPTGSTTYSYRVSAVDENGGVSAASAPVIINDGNDTLGKITPSIRGLAFNHVSWSTSAPGAALWRSKSGGDYELIGVFGLGQSDSIANGCLDAGLPEFTIPWVPATPPDSPLNDRLITSVVSGGGTTSIALADSAVNSGSGFYTRHDDTAAINAALAGLEDVKLTSGTYNVGSLSAPNTLSSVKGEGYSSTLYGWGARSAVINIQSKKGFNADNFRVYSTAWHNQIGIQLNSGDNSIVENCYSSGNLPIFLVSCSSTKVTNNILEDWIDSGIFDLNGTSNTIEDNFINEGCEAIPQNAAAIHGFNVNQMLVKDNRTFGKHIYSVKFETGNFNVMEGNWVINSWAESYHITGSCTGCKITDNTMYGGDLKMDYAISISNDDRPNVTLFANEISGNTIYECGTSAIGVVEFGGVNPDIGYTIVKGNTVHRANQNGITNTPEIIINGSNVHNTYIHDHYTNSNAFIDYVVKEDAAIYGLPNNTQVGTIYGDGGGTGLVSLTGVGSGKLSGGGTGL